jgi:hypothetical protein
MSHHLKSKRAKNPDEFFDSLVRNAIDFLQMSVRELERRPKYSVIHFAMAVELLLKARLLKEHWSLIVSKIEKASIQTFRSGEFASVTTDECLQRLKNITNEALLEHEVKCFDAVRSHRNKLVHFFHSHYLSKASKSLRLQIVVEQLEAWFYLHRLLTQKWANHFSPYAAKIARLEKLIRKDRLRFLRAKFRALNPEIQQARNNGDKFKPCRMCNFESAKIASLRDPLFSAKCLVCDWTSNFLKIACSACGTDVTVESEDGGACENCKEVVDFDRLMNQFGPAFRPDEESFDAFCSSCEFHEASVIPLRDETYLCLNCLELHRSVDSCNWCGDLITGDTADTSVLGCFRCDGPDWGN